MNRESTGNAEMGSLHPEYDVIVVGARVAGASTAMLLARHGLRVLAVDRGRAGTDTLSTHALMRGGVLQLERWGLRAAVAASGTPAIRTTSFHYADEEIAIAIKPRDGVDALYAPRRTVLDAILVDAARDAGADVAHGVQVIDVTRDDVGRVNGVVVAEPGGGVRRIAAGIVIGADGLRSRIADLVEAPVVAAGDHAAAVVYGYWNGLEVNGFHWHYRPGVSAGVIPTNDRATCVFVAFSPARFHAELSGGVEAMYRRVLAESAPGLRPQLAGASLAGRLHAFPGMPGFLRRAAGPGWALVGDAGFFRDPITAHGISDALRDAELLANAIARGGDQALAAYEATRDELAGGFLEISDRVAAFDWDLEEVKVHHLALSKQMAREVDLLRALALPPAAAALA